MSKLSGIKIALLLTVINSHLIQAQISNPFLQFSPRRPSAYYNENSSPRPGNGYNNNYPPQFEEFYNNNSPNPNIEEHEPGGGPIIFNNPSGFPPSRHPPKQKQQRPQPYPIPEEENTNYGTLSPGHWSQAGSQGHGNFNPEYFEPPSMNSQNIPNSGSKSISGDYCWDPFFGCDTANTILYCMKTFGRCTCPTNWTLTPGNLALNTVWDPTSRRCVSLIGSGCHVDPTGTGNGFVYCQPGVQCVPHPALREVGTCGELMTSNVSRLLVATTIFLLIIRK